MFLYLPFEQVLFAPDIGHYHTFGLQVIHVENGIEKELIRVDDVSTDTTFIHDFAHLLTTEQLHPIHLYDVIEDFI